MIPGEKHLSHASSYLQVFRQFGPCYDVYQFRIHQGVPILMVTLPRPLSKRSTIEKYGLIISTSAQPTTMVHQVTAFQSDVEIVISSQGSPRCLVCAIFVNVFRLISHHVNSVTAKRSPVDLLRLWVCSANFDIPTNEGPPPLVNFLHMSICFFQVKPNLTSPYAYLAMEIQQEPSSLEIITEVDPLNVAELLGNIGGFWGRFHQREGCMKGRICISIGVHVMVMGGCLGPNVLHIA